MTTTTTADWQPNYDIDGELLDCQHTITRDGHTVTAIWSPEHGHGVYLDHDGDEFYTITELRDLVNVLQQYLNNHDHDHA